MMLDDYSLERVTRSQFPPSVSSLPPAFPTARDKSERAFGMAFVKLMNADGTTLQDGRHNLIVYKVRYLLEVPDRVVVSHKVSS